MGYRPSRSRVDARRLARAPRSVAPHAYRGRISRPRGSPFVSPPAGHCPLRETGKQVLERELTCPSRPFHSALLSRKTPFPEFFDQNKSYSYASAGVQLPVDMRQLGHRGHLIFTSPLPSPPPLGSAPCPRRVFESISHGVHGHAWPLMRRANAFHLS